MFMAVIVKRLFLMKQERRQQAFIDKWRPILLDNLYSAPDSLTAVAAKDTLSFLILWSNMQETLQGEAKDQLNVLARSLEMDQRAIEMLSSRKLSRRLLAVTVLGHLREDEVWADIESLVYEKRITLAINALHALARINPLRATHVIVPFLAETDNWPEYRVANILYGIGSKIFAGPLAEATLAVAPEKQIRLLSLLRYSERAVVVPLVKKLLNDSSDEEVLSASLNLLGMFGDNREAELAKRFIKHPSPFIRIRAVTALGNVTNGHDMKSLEDCLGDSAWWVRYRAAQAIAAFPHMTRSGLERMRDLQTDRFAADILNYVLSQKGV